MTSADRSGGPAVPLARGALLYERESDGGVTTLVILERNDSDAELAVLADWLASVDQACPCPGTSPRSPRRTG
jgi:hypothetical protein